MFLVFTRDTLLVEYLKYKTILLDSFCKHNFCQICKSRLLQVQISIFIYFSRLFRFSLQQLVFKCWSQVLSTRPQCISAHYNTVCNLQAFHVFPWVCQDWISWSLDKPEGNILRQISFRPFTHFHPWVPESHLHYARPILLERDPECGSWMALKCATRATRRNTELLQEDNHQASLLSAIEEKCLSQSLLVPIHAIQHRMESHLVGNLWSKRIIYSTWNFRTLKSNSLS